MEKSSKFKRFLTRIGDVRLGQIWEKLRKPFNFCWKTGLAIFAIAFVYKKVKDKITPEINLKMDETIEDWFGN